jgi:cell division protein ZapA
VANEAQTLSLKILDREYRVNCPSGAEQQLRDSARFLDERMREIKDASSASGKVPGMDRIAVIAALNISHQLLEVQEELKSQQDTLAKLNSQLDDALNISLQREL